MSTPIDAFGDELKRRMENPFWGSFIISWLLINWKVVYITFSWSSKEIDDKIQYIENLYKFSSFMEGLWSFTHLLVLPLIASAIAVWWIPILAREYLKKQLKNKEADDRLKIKEIKSEKLVIQEKIDLQEKEQQLQKSEQDIWDEEYIKIEQAGVIPALVDFIFGNNGRRYDARGNENISTYYFATFITSGLIQDGESGYELSSKGKYMIQKYPTNKLKEQLDPILPF